MSYSFSRRGTGISPLSSSNAVLLARFNTPTKQVPKYPRWRGQQVDESTGTSLHVALAPQINPPFGFENFDHVARSESSWTYRFGFHCHFFPNAVSHRQSFESIDCGDILPVPFNVRITLDVSGVDVQRFTAHPLSIGKIIVDCPCVQVYGSNIHCEGRTFLVLTC